MKTKNAVYNLNNVVHSHGAYASVSWAKLVFTGTQDPRQLESQYRRPARKWTKYPDKIFQIWTLISGSEAFQHYFSRSAEQAFGRSVFIRTQYQALDPGVAIHIW